MVSPFVWSPCHRYLKFLATGAFLKFSSTGILSKHLALLLHLFPANFWLRLAVVQFLGIFSFICSLIFLKNGFTKLHSCFFQKLTCVKSFVSYQTCKNKTLLFTGCDKKSGY